MRLLGERIEPRPGHFRPLPVCIEVAAGTDLVAAELARALERECAERPSEAAVHAEFALQLADAREPCREQVLALRVLCRTATDRRQEEEAVGFGRRAAALALQLQELDLWAAAMVEWAEAHRGYPASAAAAAALHLEMIARGAAWDRPDVARAGAEALAGHALEDDDPERAVELAWRALDYLDAAAEAEADAHAPGDPAAHARRRAVLSGLLAAGLARLGLAAAAEQALEPPPDASPAMRVLLRAAAALALAGAGRPERMLDGWPMERAPDEVLAAVAGERLEEAELAVRAGIWMARALWLARLPREARAYAQSALELARRGGDRALVRQARATLDAAALGEPVALALPMPGAVREAVRAIAYTVEHGHLRPLQAPSS